MAIEHRAIPLQEARDIQKRLKKITREESEKYELLGQPWGTCDKRLNGLEHCIILGLRHGKDFSKRVKYYVERTPDNLETNDMRYMIANIMKPILEQKGQKIAMVDFYGDKKRDE